MNETGNKRRFVKNKSLAFCLMIPMLQDDGVLSSAMNRALVPVTAAGSRYCTTLTIVSISGDIKETAYLHFK
jgi:hypothetical protein